MSFYSYIHVIRTILFSLYEHIYTTYILLCLLHKFRNISIFLLPFKLYCANGDLLRGTRLLYKWQRKLSNRRSYQLSSIVTIWDVPLQTMVGNMFKNSDRMMFIWCNRMVQPLPSLCTWVRCRAHLNGPTLPR
jgi:hypothetical protein